MKKKKLFNTSFNVQIVLKGGTNAILTNMLQQKKFELVKLKKKRLGIYLKEH